MKIGIIGAGAIGLLFASYIGEKHDVYIVTKSKEQAEAINTQGIHRNVQGTNVQTRISAESILETAIQALPLDLVVVAVKQYSIHSIASLISSLHPSIPLLFLQNGMDHLDFIQRLPQSTILLGSVEHGAQRLNQHTVLHKGIGTTKVSSYKGDIKNILPLLESMDPVFAFTMVQNGKEMLLKKLFINILINPLTAISKVKNGQLLANPYLHALQHQLYEEMISVFPDMKESVSFDEIVAVCRNTGENYSSMFKDIENGNKTEVEAILGFVIKEALLENVEIPKIKMLYQLVKGLEWQKGVE